MIMMRLKKNNKLFKIMENIYYLKMDCHITLMENFHVNCQL